MKKCNYCGSTENQIVYSHIYEPRACEVCVPTFFRNVGGKVYPMQYNSVEYVRMLSSLNPRVRDNIGKQLQDIFDKRIARDMRVAVMSNRVRWVFSTEYRRKFGFIVIELDAITGMVKALVETDEEKVRILAMKISQGSPIF